MIKIEFIDPKEFTAPLAGSSVHLLGQMTDVTRDLYWNLLVTADPIQADEGYKIKSPNVTWTWSQNREYKLNAQANSPVAISIPGGESRLSYIQFSPRIDTKPLADGTYQVTAILRDGTIPLASCTHDLRIDQTNLHEVTQADKDQALAQWQFAVDRNFVELRKWKEGLEAKVANVERIVKTD